MNRRHATLAALSLAAALTLTACGSAASTSSSAAPPPPAASPSAAAAQPSAAAAQPSAAAAQPSSADSSSAPCLTHACVVTVLEQSLPSIVARDGSVITKAVCYKSSVRHNSADTYTASCDVTYSDQTVWSGYATLLVAEQKVSWQPEQQVS